MVWSRGSWMNYGAPRYVAMGRNSEAGAEIQNMACGKIGVAITLLLVKSKDEREKMRLEKKVEI